MRNLLLASAFATILALTGCGGTEPTVDDSQAAQNSDVQDLNIVDSDAQSSADSQIDLDSKNVTLESIESKMTPIYFAFDTYKLTSEDVDTLHSNVQLVKADAEAMQIANKYSLKLEGNCDEWGSDEYNFALGLKRAKAVKDELISEGIDSSRITTVSYGSSSPVCTDKTQECWSKNRRVDFKLLP